MSEEEYENPRSWYRYEGESEDETIAVYRRCSCGRFLPRSGKVLMNRLGEVKLSDWKCSKCGDVQPHWERW